MNKGEKKMSDIICEAVGQLNLDNIKQENNYELEIPLCDKQGNFMCNAKIQLKGSELMRIKDGLLKPKISIEGV